MTRPQTDTAPLREGFTTGSAATAAAMAALRLLLAPDTPTAPGTPDSAGTPSSVDVPLPPFPHSSDGAHGVDGVDGVHGASAPGACGDGPPLCLTVPVEKVWRDADDAHTALASVIKDGGDDPDATHGARIVARVTLTPLPAGALAADALAAHSGPPDLVPEASVRILGGAGVGRITLPGLPLPVGEAAINPVPRQQITHGLRQVARAAAFAGSVCVTISVPDGEELARHTFNPRLGIVGGISILGTQGTVKPYSHDAWKATIHQGMDVAEATGCSTLCLSTGRRSEKLLLAQYPHLPPQAAVQVADFAEYSLREAGTRPFDELVWGCFFGKLVKLAQGHSYTHARSAELNFALLARWCTEAGAKDASARAIEQCVTANHALELLLDHEGEGNAVRVVRAIALKAAAVAARFAHNPERPARKLRLHVFHLNGKELVRV